MRRNNEPTRPEHMAGIILLTGARPEHGVCHDLVARPMAPTNRFFPVTYSTMFQPGVGLRPCSILPKLAENIPASWFFLFLPSESHRWADGMQKG